MKVFDRLKKKLKEKLEEKSKPLEPTTNSTEKKTPELSEDDKKRKERELSEYKENFEREYQKYLQKKKTEREKGIGIKPPNYEGQDFPFERQSSPLSGNVKIIDVTSSESSNIQIEPKIDNPKIQKPPQPKPDKITIKVEDVKWFGKYKKWTDKEEELLTKAYRVGSSIDEIAKLLDRTEGAIVGRIKLLKLVEITGRELPISSYQRNFIVELGGSITEGITRKKASLLIDELIQKNGSQIPPHTMQLSDLQLLGYSDTPKNFLEAQNIIDELARNKAKELGIELSENMKTFQIIQLIRKKVLKPLEKKKKPYIDSKNECKICDGNGCENCLRESCPKCNGDGCDFCDMEGTKEVYDNKKWYRCSNCDGVGCLYCNEIGTVGAQKEEEVEWNEYNFPEEYKE